MVTGTLKSWIIPLIGSLSSINFIILWSVKRTARNISIVFICKARLHIQNYTVQELIILWEELVILFVPLYQPVLGIVLRLPRVLGGRRLRVRGEQVLHCKFAWVSTSMGVRIRAEMINTDPVSFFSLVLINFFSVQRSLLDIIVDL